MRLHPIHWQRLIDSVDRVDIEFVRSATSPIGIHSVSLIDPDPPQANDRFGATQFVDIAATAGEITPLNGGSTTLTEIGETWRWARLIPES